jgi:hypothetical protein
LPLHGLLVHVQVEGLFAEFMLDRGVGVAIENAHANERGVNSNFYEQNNMRELMGEIHL